MVTSRDFSSPSRSIRKSHSIRMLALGMWLCSSAGSWGQFTIERSPWLDSEAITDDPIEQIWTVIQKDNGSPLSADLVVEGINPRKPVGMTIEQDAVLQLQPFRQYTRICVKPSFMLYADQVFADPKQATDTLRLRPLEIGMEQELAPIEFIPGSEQLHYTSRPMLEALLEFFEVNPTVSLAIIGHEQFQADQVEEEMQSRDRARAIAEYLVTSGVDPRRIELEGKGAQELKYPKPRNVAEAEANRRISIRITNY